MIIANQPIDVTADPPVPPRSDNYLHYTGDVGGLLGVRRPHRVQYRIGIETPQSTPGRKAPSTFTVDRRRNCHQRCLRNFEAAQVASHYYKTEHIGSLTQFGEFTAARRTTRLWNLAWTACGNTLS